MTFSDTEKGRAVSPIIIEHIRVRPDRVEVLVRIESERFAWTDKSMVDRVLTDYPTLGVHACRNHKGPFFRDVMYRTSVPHLLEHMIVDWQTRKATDGERIFTGTTQWNVEDPLLAQITFSYEDDLVALEALKHCTADLNSVLSEL